MWEGSLILWRALLVQECITEEAEGNYLVEGMEAWVKGEGSKTEGCE